MFHVQKIDDLILGWKILRNSFWVKKTTIFKFSPNFYFFLSKSEYFILNHNLGHNIMKLFDILPNFSFIKVETERDYY